MLRVNGGRIGPRRTGASVYTGSGVWVPREQVFAAEDANKDSLFSQVALLLPFNGNNGSTTFTDASNNNFTVTGSGSAAISTSQSKFGGASLNLPSAGSKLTLPASGAALSLGGDLTLEFWAYRTGTTGGGYDSIFSAANESTFLMRIGGANPTVSVRGAAFATPSSLLTLNTWQHVAVTRNSGLWKLWLDGSDATTATVSDSASLALTSAIIGESSVANRTFIGFIDDFRLTNGTARYTAAFTPPTRAHFTS